MRIKETIMLMILWIAGIISGFAFSLFLISAVRSKDEENEVMTYTFLSCLTFGICVLSILVTIAYS